MAMKINSGVTGDAWQSKLLHVQYKGEKICARHEYFFCLDQIVEDRFGFYSITSNSPLRSRITKARAFIIDLPVKRFVPKVFEKPATHHIVELEAETGDYFTLEKGTDCILLQSCRRENPNEQPVIRRQRDGRQRPKLLSLERIITEHNPKSTTVFDLLKWLNDKGSDGQKESRLMEIYHVADSNCQHFAAHLWHELSGEGYPNPSRYNSEGSTLELAREDSKVAPASPQDTKTNFFSALLTPQLKRRHSAKGQPSVNPKGLIINRHTIVSPVIPIEQLSTSHPHPKFPGGEGFLAEFLDGRLIVWGGIQKQVGGHRVTLPLDIIFCYNLNHHSLIEGKATSRWEVIKAKGEIPDGFYDAASVVCNQNIFIFGGCQNLETRQLSNFLTTLSSSGHFKRLRPVGAILSPRAYHRGFTYDRKIYYFGGVVVTADSFGELENLVPDASGGFITNELVGLDPVSTHFARILTTGARPLPRADCAIATLDEKVFVHGGSCSNNSLNDFFVLNMETKVWTEIHNTGFSRGIACHTLTRLPLNRILLVGGLQFDGPNYRNSNAVKIFDAEKLEWEEEFLLPPEFDGSEGGFNAHRTVEMQTENGSIFICLGGFADAALSKHPNRMIQFYVHE